jgi:hypothetical protein
VAELLRSDRPGTRRHYIVLPYRSYVADRADAMKLLKSGMRVAAKPVLVSRQLDLSRARRIVTWPVFDRKSWDSGPIFRYWRSSASMPRSEGYLMIARWLANNAPR